MAIALLVVVAAFFLAMGVYALVAPAALARPFGIVAGSPEARAEIRAVYGGFGVAVAALLAVAVADAGGLRRGIAVTVAVALAGMAGGRVVSRLADRATAFYPIWCYFCVEVVGAALLVPAAVAGGR
ncbi:DUF4345 family protein [Actinophytocola sp. KF-1]